MHPPINKRIPEIAKEEGISEAKLLTTIDGLRFPHCLGELFKHTTSADVDYQLLNYQDADKFEVDVVIENTGGQLVGVEVKASATVRERDLRGLKKLARLAGNQFTSGVLLYDGDETLPLGSNIWASPLSTLWGS